MARRLLYLAQGKILVLMLAVLLALPVGAATWFTSGTYEPDTACDDANGCTDPQNGKAVSGGWMYADAPGAGVDELRIYLNGYAVAVQGSGVNPNSDLTGSRHQAPSLTFYAYFGVWKDCNDDGYIGMANGALHVYSSQLGVDESICEEGSVFNKGGWVYEFQWIGPGNTLAGEGAGDYPSADDVRYINDSAARVWSDWDLPGHFSVAGSSCPTGPTFGVTASTGAMIAHADCIASRKIANTINDASDATGLGFGFEDPNAPYRSKSVLNQDTPVNLFGNPYSGEDNDEWQTGLLEYNSRKDRQPGYDDDLDYDPDQDNRAFDAWDCSQQEDFAGLGLFTTGKLDPKVSEDPLHASWYDGLNATERGLNGAEHWVLNDVTGISSNGLLGANTQTCSEDQVTNVWWGYGGVESGEPGTDDVGPGRNAVETIFSFSLGGQPARGCQTNIGNQLAEGPQVEDEEVAPGVWIGTSGECKMERANLGVDSGAVLNETLGDGYQYGPDLRGPVVTRPGWTGTPPWLTTGPINRRTLEPNSGRYVTIYGAVGSVTTGTGAVAAKGSAALYANEWCAGTFTADSVADGFDCDASRWYPAGEPQANGISLAIRPGHPYVARDIDCYDGTIARGVPAQASLVAASEFGPCIDSVN